MIVVVYDDDGNYNINNGFESIDNVAKGNQGDEDDLDNGSNRNHDDKDAAPDDDDETHDIGNIVADNHHDIMLIFKRTMRVTSGC